MPDDLMVAIVTGQHVYDVPNFHRLFRALSGIDAYIQPLEDWAVDEGRVRDRYDAVVFYNFHQATPSDQGSTGEKAAKAAVEQLGQTKQGIVVLHHAMLAYRQWPLWSEVVGIADRGFGYYHDQVLQLEIADPNHPITRDLQPWEMVDETYTVNEPGAGCDILLTVDHPKSMRNIAWTRNYGRARVFCCELGHDNQAWAHPSFRTLLERAILWVAGRV